jgi:5-formyltetrahydrofolate cyclo-ligase
MAKPDAQRPNAAPDPKTALRQTITHLAQAMPPEARCESDRQLRSQFLACPQLERAKTVLLYASMGTEIDTTALFAHLAQQHKRLLLPRCLPHQEMEARLWQPTHLVRHRYGMWEPDTCCPIVPKAEIDLILVPALCYDRSGQRLGHGGGYYDRYLADCSGFTVGLCRASLLQQQLPAQPWDRPVDLVLTEFGPVFPV